jgi:hypothetical protein
MTVNSCQITNALRQKWPEAIRSLTDQSDRFFSTGQTEIDAFFPSGRGIPYGQLIEITGGVSSGKTSLLFRLIAANPRTTAYVDFGNSFFPDAADAAGLDLSRLLVIKPTSQLKPTINGGPPEQLKPGLRSGELLLRDRHADIIVFDLVKHHTPLPIGLLHRLRLKTVLARGLVIFLTQTAGIIPASMTSLRLEVQRTEVQRTEVQRANDPLQHLLITVTKSRLCAEGLRCQVRL